MNLDSIIELIRQQNTDSFGRLSSAGEQAIALIRAGQAMRTGIRLLPNTEHPQIDATNDAHLAKAAEAWDDATKGDDE